MPVYEYKCEGCNIVFDLLCPIAQHASTKPCPQCTGLAQQHITPPNICIEPRHQACGSVLSYHGVVNPITGERRKGKLRK